MTNKNVGVKIESNEGNTYQCQVCGIIYSPMLGCNGRMPKNYKHCPNGCEEDMKERQEIINECMKGRVKL
jgi:hypothetical protein